MTWVAFIIGALAVFADNEAVPIRLAGFVLIGVAVAVHAGWWGERGE